MLGIEDDGTVYGIGDESPFKLSDSISNMISAACTPQIEPAIVLSSIDNKTIIDMVNASAMVVLVNKTKIPLYTYISYKENPIPCCT